MPEPAPAVDATPPRAEATPLRGDATLPRGDAGPPRGVAAALDWRRGVPISREFLDPYYSLEGGLAEVRHVFLGGTGLPERLRPGLRVLETGFGTGLTLLGLMAAARGLPDGSVRFTSVEAHPLRADDRARALRAFPEVAGEARRLLAAMAGPGAQGGPWRLGPVTAEVLWGDARALVPAWEGQADAVMLDGFAPARNPEMWEPPLLAAVAARMAPGARLASFTAAGEVRRALEAAGLRVERRPGFGRKRHMTVAWRPGDRA